MNVSITFDGLADMIRQAELLATQSEIDAVNKRIHQRSADAAKPKMKAHMARSANNAKSGRNGYRPPGHASDNIPVKATAKKGEVGWKLNGDAENWFYMKFVEWGTSKQPPKDFIYNTMNESESEFREITEQEYQQLINQKLGG